jgi:hypothetical protein
MATTQRKKIVKVVDIVKSKPKQRVRKQEYEIQQPAYIEYAEQEIVARTSVPAPAPAAVDDFKFEALRDFEHPHANRIDDGGDVDAEEEEERRDVAEHSLERGHTVRIPKRHVERSRRPALAWVAGALVLAGLAYMAITALPKVAVRIVTKKVSFAFGDSITVAKNAAAGSNQIPGEIVISHSTNSFTFTATAKKHVERKASGKVTFYNAYGTAPQTLIATTRLESPDGKTFRIASRVTIPGGKKNGNVIEPGSVEADVVADQPGDSYNIDPVEKFVIPGFKGTDKYQKVYAQSLDPMSGGFVGDGYYPSDEDVKAAEEKAVDQMRSNMASLLNVKDVPKGFTYVKGSEKFAVISKKTEIDPSADNKFNVAIEAEMSAFIYKESDVADLMQKIGTDNKAIPADYVKKSDEVAYKMPQISWDAGTMVLPLDYKATYWKPVDQKALAGDIAGKKDADLKTYVLSIPSVDKVTANFWPFWVSHVPSKTERISISVE